MCQRFTHKEAIETGAKEQQAAAENKDIGELAGNIKNNPGDHRRQRCTEETAKVLDRAERSNLLFGAISAASAQIAPDGICEQK